MRTYLILAMFIASLADAAWNDHAETRNPQHEGRAKGVGRLTDGNGSRSLHFAVSTAATCEATGITSTSAALPDPFCCQ